MDATNHHAGEPNEDKQNARITALAELELLQEPLDYQSVLRRIVQVTERLLPATGGASIVLWDSQERRFSVSASTVPGQPPGIAAQRARLEGGATRWIIDYGRPVIVPDIRDDPFGANPMLDEYGLKAYVGVPIRSEGQVVGVLYGLDRHPREYSQEDIDFLCILAGRAGSAISIARLITKIELLAIQDHLTGVYNREAFFARAEAELVRANRFGHPVSLLMVDIDHFKSINDRFGHLVGDRVIQQVVRRLRSMIRQVDLLARWGGDEFVILLPETNLQGAQCLAERLCEQTRVTPFQADDRAVPVTVSIGVAALSESDPDVSALVNRADMALYAAKQSGRNRVVVHTEGA